MSLPFLAHSGYTLENHVPLATQWLHGTKKAKPSATAEGYRPRSVDALRPYLAQIEAHILEQAGVSSVATVEPGKLALVAG